VAKYFFFSSLDTQVTFSASLKVLAELHSQNWMDSAHRAEWVRALHRGKARIKNPTVLKWAGIKAVAGFLVPTNLDFNTWASFLSTALTEESEAVLLSQILGFTDHEIAAGLEVSEGTVRYRVGRGLRHLGGFLES